MNPRPTRRDAVLAAIERFTRERGYAPTIRELCVEVGAASTSTVYYHLQDLMARGAVTWEPGLTRTLRLTGGGAA